MNPNSRFHHTGKVSNLKCHAIKHSDEDLKKLDQIRGDREKQSASSAAEPATLLTKFLLVNPCYMKLLEEEGFVEFLKSVNVDVEAVEGTLSFWSTTLGKTELN